MHEVSVCSSPCLLLELGARYQPLSHLRTTVPNRSHVASTNRTASSFRRLFTLCFAGIRMRLSATSICRMFRQLSGKRTIGSLSLLGSRLFEQVDGLRGRGWTLQELLALSPVDFFSQRGKRLGDKRTLERQVHEITGIAVSALQGTPLSQFGVDE
jgi:hypothetical protein